MHDETRLTYKQASTGKSQFWIVTRGRRIVKAINVPHPWATQGEFPEFFVPERTPLSIFVFPIMGRPLDHLRLTFNGAPEINSVCSRVPGNGRQIFDLNPLKSSQNMIKLCLNFTFQSMEVLFLFPYLWSTGIVLKSKIGMLRSLGKDFYFGTARNANLCKPPGGWKLVARWLSVADEEISAQQGWNREPPDKPNITSPPPTEDYHRFRLSPKFT
ncbi:unnamed protein product [Nesidiocoris tenuis]|uniref:Uncharacterized protein n=1 Tax=Nesidiocoris tenuis TaxID=355587 RepID=A0A6H5H3C6_9HEMI|nr:unnamed protein product [Nesidiocoris tenuis]